MITGLLLGAGLGTGLWALVAWIAPPRPGLHATLTAITAGPAPVPLLTADSAGWSLRIGKPFVRPLASLGLPTPRLRRDLAVIGKSPQHHLAEMAVYGIAGLVLPTLAQALLLVADIPMPWQMPALAGLILGIVGLLVPDLTVRQEAARRRDAFRHSLGAYLNLLRVLLAGGAGVDGALTDAVKVGNGWAFAQIRRALTTAAATRTTPWARLGQLGTELDVSELSELAASLSLAGTEGARVRASLAAKASGMRTRELTHAEGEAQSATERMSLPVLILFLGFLIFLGFPAMSRVLIGL
ncbi:type II secretion system F family protein [Actinokineospora inagensis]|uniref:type II secretion system F family protein n=1 Tax=Actinokineospora inagensis TaxID=103730 RepID=UPI0004173109|nr:type II secretion system F family protein [Actinokineospora inagensis]